MDQILNDIRHSRKPLNCAQILSLFLIYISIFVSNTMFSEIALFIEFLLNFLDDKGWSINEVIVKRSNQDMNNTDKLSAQNNNKNLLKNSEISKEKYTLCMTSEYIPDSLNNFI